MFVPRVVRRQLKNLIRLQKFDAVRRCINTDFKCERIAIENLKHFISKEALNIDELGKKVIEKFWDLNLIKKPQDIFNLNYSKIKNLDGLRQLSVNNLKDLFKIQRLIFSKIYYSIGIRHIGIENAKIIVIM